MKKTLALLLVLLGLPWQQPAAATQAEPFSAALAAVRLPEGKGMPEARAQIEAWCLLADSTIRIEEPETISVACTLAEEEGAWYALQWWIGRAADGMCLATLRFDPDSGELRLPEEETLAVLGDAAYLRAMVALRAHGIALEPGWYAQRATQPLLLAWLVRAYEALQGAEVSLEGVTAASRAAPAMRKAAALRLLSPEELAADASVPLTRQDMAVALLRWAEQAEAAHFRTAALPATVADAQRALQLAADLAGIPLDVLAAWRPKSGEKGQAKPLTRAVYARGVMALLERLDPKQKTVDARWMPKLDDTEHRDARRACGQGLMTYVTLEPEGFLCFDPDRVMTREAVWAHAIRFVRVAMAEPPEGRDDVPTIGDAALRMHRLTRAFAEHPRLAEPVRVVDNGVSWPWYFAQEDSGAFSANNCMPAAAAMVLRWLDPDSAATPESLRAAEPLDGNPWYPEQVSAALDQRGVSYVLADIDPDRMIDSLDAGHILLVLLNEGSSGHCVVVKGYEREGQGLWFRVYDPASPASDVYGRPVGQDRRIEASQLIFAMECHWWLLFDIAREGND